MSTIRPKKVSVSVKTSIINHINYASIKNLAIFILSRQIKSP